MPKSKRLFEDEDSEMFDWGKASKAPKISQSLSRSKSPDKNDTRLSPFEEMINKCGYHLAKDKKALHRLDVDQVVFQQKLEKILKYETEKTTDFLESLKSYLEDADNLHWCLMPTGTSEECLSARGGNQDSLARILLGIEVLQIPLANFLLEKIVELTSDDIHSEESSEISFPKLILSQFRWLNKIINSKDLTQKMIEILTVASLGVQREIILAFPDIINDSEHLEVAKHLSSLFSENQDLTVCILDTLSNLNIPFDSLEEIHENVLKTLPSVNADDLPVVVKFILENVEAPNAVTTITDLRENLHFTASFPPAASSTPRSRVSLSKERGSEFLTIDAIRTTMRFHKCIADSWIKVIEACKQPAEQKVIDFIVLLVLHSLGNHKKPVESLLRNKIRVGLITESRLQVSFAAHPAILREYFPTILSLSATLLRSLEPVISSVGSSLYALSFLHFDTYCQQEVIGSLITHLGSGSNHEMDASLGALEVLAKKHTSKMAQFGTFIKCVLDYLDNLKLMQVRTVYSVLCYLAYHGGPQGAMLQDDIHMIIRKQLTNGNPKYQRMGVIGALMAAKVMSQCSDSAQSTIAQSQTSVSQESSVSEIQKQAIDLLELVRSSTSCSPEAMALFCEELARVLMKNELDDRIEAWIEEVVINDFQDDFVIDVEENKETSQKLIQMSLQFDLDGESSGGIALNLLPLIVKDESQKLGKNSSSGEQKHVSPIILSSLFRLLWNCEKAQHGGNLEEIDALLGCPVYMPSSYVMDKFSTIPSEERAIVVTSLFHCINWFRELINAFALNENAEMKAKVVSRLRNIIALQDHLKMCLPAMLNYQPPKANFDVDEMPVPECISQMSSNKGKKRGRKPKSKICAKSSCKAQEPVSQLATPTQTNKEVDTTQDPLDNEEKSDESIGQNGPLADLQAYKYFFRELDLDVFSLLEFPLNMNDCDDKEMYAGQPVPKVSSTTLKPQELRLLLDDLTRKLDFALLASNSKRFSHLKVKVNKQIGHSTLSLFSAKEIIAKLVLYLPFLCQHLETINTHFQDIIADHDGIVDSMDMFSNSSIVISDCLRHIFSVLNSILSWKGFSNNIHTDLLRKILSIMSSRRADSLSSETSIQNLAKYTFEYIMKFSNVTCIENAIGLIQLLETIHRIEGESSLANKLSAAAEDFLKRHWEEVEGMKKQKKSFNDHIEILVKMYIIYSSDVLVPLNELTTVIVPELIETEGRNPISSTFPTLNKYTFPAFYRVMLSQLVEAAKSISSSRTERSRAYTEQLNKWSSIIGLFQIQVNLIKVLNSRANLATCLKHGRQFVDQFLRTGMPLLDKLFRGHIELVQGLLKKLQSATRFLQHVCSHSKVIKDITLTNHVPFLKKTLEILVYRVKKMLDFNKCSEAFWIGNLKNRDLQGEEILSQSIDGEESEDSSDEDDASDHSDVDLESRGGVAIGEEIDDESSLMF